MILFTAPVDFDNAVAEAIAKLDDVMWAREPRGNPDVWVCDPKAPFVIDGDVLARMPRLGNLVTPSTGKTHIDDVACKRYNVAVYSLLDRRHLLEEISASAEHTLSLLLQAFRLPPPREIQGRRIGLVGMGRIGRKLTRYLEALGANVWYYDPYVLGQRQTSREDIFRNSEAIVICCAVTDETLGMIGWRHLPLLQDNAVFVNTARGEIVDEQILLAIMRQRPLRVALDVLEGDNKGHTRAQAFEEAGAILTPHIAGATLDSRTKAAKICLDILRDIYGTNSRQ